MKYICNKRSVLLKYCMTHSVEESGGGIFVGNAKIKAHNVTNSPGFITLPNNVPELNGYTLCHYLSVSYYCAHGCMDCSNRSSCSIDRKSQGGNLWEIIIYYLRYHITKPPSSYLH